MAPATARSSGLYDPVETITPPCVNIITIYIITGCLSSLLKAPSIRLRRVQNAFPRIRSAYCRATVRVFPLGIYEVRILLRVPAERTRTALNCIQAPNYPQMCAI